MVQPISTKKVGFVNSTLIAFQVALTTAHGSGYFRRSLGGRVGLIVRRSLIGAAVCRANEAA